MAVECEEFEYCKVKVHYIADSDLVVEKREEAISELKKMKVKVPGFRTAPKNIHTKKKGKSKRKKNKKPKNYKNSLTYERSLKKAFGDHINSAIKKELVAEAYDEVLFETKMKPIGYPEISGSNLDGDTFECDLVFYKRPEFELGEYKGFDVPPPHVEETATARAQKMIQMLRERHGEIVSYGEEDFVQDKDSVTLDVKSVCDGKEIEHLTKKGMLYTVGQNTMEEFDQNLFGMKPGEERVFDIMFEDKETVVEELRNSRVTFTVNLHMGTKLIPCSLDDEFAKKLGYKKYEEMRMEAEGTASSQIEQQRRQQITHQVLTRILSNHDFEVPSWLVLKESQLAAYQLQLKWDELDDDQIKNLNEQSTEKVKLTMVLESIRENEPDAVFSEEELISKLRMNLEMNGKNPDEVLSRAHKDGTLIGLLASLKDEATIAWLVEQSNIINEVANG